MNNADIIILILMGITVVSAAGSFSIITRYLFDRGLADPDDRAPNVLTFYKTYMASTRKETGRIGTPFWIHCISAGIFITTGVIYTIYRFIIPRLF